MMQNLASSFTESNQNYLKPTQTLRSKFQLPSKSLEKKSIHNSSRSHKEKSGKLEETPKKKLKKKEEKNIEYVYPSHLEVIEKIKKIKSLSQPLPFSPASPPPVLRNFYSAYGKKSPNLQKKIRERQNKIEFELPEEPKKMDLLLKRIKETERVIRQENEFIYKVRKFKPKIQLTHAMSNSMSKSKTRTVKFAKRNMTPIQLNRSGIVLMAVSHQ